MSRGYVYILSNPSMPGLVKIGRTERSVEQRAGELWQTGVPTPFVVEYYQLFPNCKDAESRLHATFDHCRETDAREFFRVTTKVVVEEIDRLIIAALGEIVQTYSSGLRVANYSESMALSVLDNISAATGIKHYMLGLAAGVKPLDEIWKDVQKAQVKVAQVNANREGVE